MTVQQTRVETRRAIEAVWRIEAARLIAGLARVVNDLGLAEELAQDALVAALEQWPESGIPRNPGAWLMTVGKRRAIDTLRRHRRLRENIAELGRAQGDESVTPDFEAALDEPIEDDVLRLIFTACHPVLPRQARVALTLRMVGGLRTDEIARAFLTGEQTVAKRITRAKRTLAEAGVPFEVPPPDERPERLASVLEVIYLIFNEGYSATAGDEWLRPALCADALRLGRVLAALVPGEPEVHGLVALMEIQASRSAARTGPSGEPVLLLEQDRARWDRLLIRRGLAALDRAEALSGRRAAADDAGEVTGADVPGTAGPRTETAAVADRAAVAAGDAQEDGRPGGVRGQYTLQAAIAACHVRAHTAEETDWARISALYAELARVTPSPVVELNRAVAVAMADGPAAGLRLIDALVDDPALAGYHLLPSVRGDLLARLGRLAEAAEEFGRAAALTRNERERALLLDRAAACAGGSPPAR